MRGRGGRKSLYERQGRPEVVIWDTAEGRGRSMRYNNLVSSCDYMASVVSEWRTNMEQQQNATEGENPNYLQKNPSRCYFVYHKSHIDWPGIELVPPMAGINWITPSTTLTFFCIEEGSTIFHRTSVLFVIRGLGVRQTPSLKGLLLYHSKITG
jgi:hypothetical protein